MLDRLPADEIEPLRAAAKNLRVDPSDAVLEALSGAHEKFGRDKVDIAPVLAVTVWDDHGVVLEALDYEPLVDAFEADARRRGTRTM